MSETQGPVWGPNVTTYTTFVDVSRLLVDCAEGRWGSTSECRIADLELLKDNSTDAEKVRQYTQLPDVLNTPVLLVEKSDGRLEVVDGHHRIGARAACGLPTVTAYVVPALARLFYGIPDEVATRCRRVLRDEVARAWLEEDGAAVNKWLKKASDDSVGQQAQPINKSELRNE